MIADSPVDPNYNPFSVPADNDIFMLRDKERQKKKQVCLMLQNTFDIIYFMKIPTTMLHIDAIPLDSWFQFSVC